VKKAAVSAERKECAPVFFADFLPPPLTLPFSMGSFIQQNLAKKATKNKETMLLCRSFFL
jgi:hypothetical protein